MLYEEYEEYKSRYYEAQRIYNDILNEKEELFAKTQPKATQITGEKTGGGKHENLFDEYLIQKERKNIDKRLEEAKSILDDRERLLKLKELEVRASKHSHDKIYRCRYIDRLTIEKTARLSNYSRSQVFNILKEIRKHLKKWKRRNKNMNKEELIGKLQMVYVGDKNALNELIGYYDGLKQGIEELQQENQKYKEVIDKAINNSQYWINYYTRLNSDERIALRL